VKEPEEQQTLPRRHFFGKNADNRLRLFNDLRTALASIDPLFSGKLSKRTMTSWRGSFPQAPDSLVPLSARKCLKHWVYCVTVGVDTDAAANPRSRRSHSQGASAAEHSWSI